MACKCLIFENDFDVQTMAVNDMISAESVVYTNSMVKARMYVDAIYKYGIEPTFTKRLSHIGFSSVVIVDKTLTSDVLEAHNWQARNINPGSSIFRQLYPNLYKDPSTWPEDWRNLTKSKVKQLWGEVTHTLANPFPCAKSEHQVEIEREVARLAQRMNEANKTIHKIAVDDIIKNLGKHLREIYGVNNISSFEGSTEFKFRVKDSAFSELCNSNNTNISFPLIYSVRWNLYTNEFIDVRVEVNYDKKYVLWNKCVIVTEAQFDELFNIIDKFNESSISFIEASAKMKSLASII